MSFVKNLDEYLKKAAFKQDHQRVVRGVVEMVKEELEKKPPKPPRPELPPPVAPPIDSLIRRGDS